MAQWHLPGVWSGPEPTLTGLYPQTSGNARVCGYDLLTQMDQIYEAMGVCPQFDILWPLLSVVETLMFYCKLKGVPKKLQRDMANEMANNVLSHFSRSVD